MNIQSNNSPNLSNNIVSKQVYYAHPPPTIDPNDPVQISFPTTEVVGHGSFGVVFATVIQETNEKVAIKKDFLCFLQKYSIIIKKVVFLYRFMSSR